MTLGRKEPTAAPASDSASTSAFRPLNDFLGALCRDRVTGFTGICTGFVVYLTGCHQVLLNPGVDDQGKLREANWFDVQRVAIEGPDRLMLDNGETPGCDLPAPVR
jgi:hypothetical protein